ncbi:outer membrane beta-barrel protein [Pontibacter vulgaris]|uniref:outer membrane beta-barrel protein n=1 Tax=Pontibacter vulgaris TaxID=2905679 RepID=UPI001FA76248|nr:outer membrane beta-barrel protein [Pontibacter vulgaris]
MSSADKQKHGNLEQEFWRRLHDAEAQPAPDIWSRIDHELTVQENSKYKNRLVFYRQLAAACIALLMVAGAAFFYHFRQDALTSTGLQPGIASNTATAAPEKTLKSEAVPEQESINPQQSIDAVSSINNATPVTEQSINSSVSESIAIADVPSQNVASQNSQLGNYASNSTAASFQKQKESAYTSNSLVDTRSIGAPKPQVNTETSVPNSMITVGATLATDESTLVQPQQNTLFPSASRAIAAVPSSINSYYKTAAQQLLLNPDANSNAAQSIDKQLQQGNKNLQKQNEALVLALNKEAGGGSEKDVAGGNSRWNVSMAYAPSYFEQNIGLPERMMVAVNQRSFAAKGPSISSATSDNMEEARDEFAKNTKPAFSYSVDVKAGFKLKNKLKLLTGLGYSQNTARTKTNYVIKQFLFKPYSGERSQLAPSTVFLPSLNNNFTTDSISVARTKNAFDVDYRYEFLTLPLGLQYEGNITKKWYWYAAGGMAANFLMKASIDADTKEVQSVAYSKESESPFRRMQFSGNMSMGVGKRISDVVTVSFGPEMRSFLSTLIENPDKAVATQGKPYSLGLNMAVNYQLGKK